MLKPLMLSALLLLSCPLFAATVTFGETVNKQQLTAVASIVATPDNYLSTGISLNCFILKIVPDDYSPVCKMHHMIGSLPVGTGTWYSLCLVTVASIIQIYPGPF